MYTYARYGRACLVEARPSVQAVFMLRYLSGALLGSIGHPMDPVRILLGAVGWSCATIAIYVFNGVTDRVEDIGNGSTRPIASGVLPVRFARTAVCLLAAIGLLCACGLGWPQVGLTAGYLFLGYIYSGPPFPMKSTFYTCSTTGMALGLATYLAGCLAGGRTLTPAMIVFALAMSFWMGGVGGIAKELSDVEGDRYAGRRTWPIVLGESRARYLLAALAPTVGVAFCAICALYSERLLWCSATVCIGALMVVAATLRLRDQDDRFKRRAPYRAFMWTQHLTHLVLVASIGETLIRF